LRISSNISALHNTRWYEYLLRFLLGGAVTVLAGLIAERYGPAVGGLFLAFPAIFPATATLISSHEQKKKAKKGLAGRERGRQLAAADAVGATMGALGLIAFALVLRQLIPDYSALFAIAAATAAWMITSLPIWLARQRFRVRPPVYSSSAPQSADQHTISKAHNRRSH
jgi:Protein of unknown function (DUF3147)